MKDEIALILDGCWQEGGSNRVNCRWCSSETRGEHDPGCPCLVLERVVQQRNALIEYIQAEKQYIRLQGAARTARKSGGSAVKERLQEATSRFESALARIRELGIEEMLS